MHSVGAWQNQPWVVTGAGSARAPPRRGSGQTVGLLPYTGPTAGPGSPSPRSELSTGPGWGSSRGYGPGWGPFGHLHSQRASARSSSGPSRHPDDLREQRLAPGRVGEGPDGRDHLRAGRSGRWPRCRADLLEQFLDPALQGGIPIQHRGALQQADPPDERPVDVRVDGRGSRGCVLAEERVVTVRMPQVDRTAKATCGGAVRRGRWRSRSARAGPGRSPTRRPATSRAARHVLA